MSLDTDELMPFTIHLNGQLCKTKEFTQSIGLIIDRKPTYKNHFENAINKGQKNWNSFQRKCLKPWGLTLSNLLFETVIQPQLIYASQFGNTQLKKLQEQQNRCLRPISKKCMSLPMSSCEVSLGVPPLDIRFQSNCAKFLTELKQINRIYWLKLTSTHLIDRASLRKLSEKI